MPDYCDRTRKEVTHVKKLIVLVALLCTVMISSTAAAANWVWIGSDDEITIYVDNNSIRRDYNYSGYVFRAFVKYVYNDTGRNRQIEWWRTNAGFLPKGIYDLSHKINLEYFKKENGLKHRCTVNSTCYKFDGNIIPEMGFSLSELQWDIINPDTVGEAVFDAVYARVPN